MTAKAATKPKPVERFEESVLTSGNAITFDYESLVEAFPNVEPGIKPLGNLGVFMIRRPKKFTATGFELPADTRATEYYNTQVAKVLALGPLAFKTVRNVDGEEVILDWPEGPWFKPGDFVRVPKYGGDRFTVKAAVREMVKMIGSDTKTPIEVTEDIIFAIFKVKEIQGVITSDPLKIRAFLD